MTWILDGDLCIISGFEEMCDNCGECEELYNEE